MTEPPESGYNLFSREGLTDALKDIEKAFQKGFSSSRPKAVDEAIEQINANDSFTGVGEDAGVAFVCIIAFWLLFTNNPVPEAVPSSILGLSLARYFVRNLLPSKSDSKQAAPTTSLNQESLEEKAAFVFISYSRQDQEYVRRLVDEFENRGLHVWLDDRIDYGSAWPRVIEEQLGKSQAFVLVMTPRSRDSHWVSCELNCALEMKKPIFPILLEGKRWLEVASIQTFDVEGGALPPERFFDRFNTVNQELYDKFFELKGGNIDGGSVKTEWNREWFINTGEREGCHRSWADCRKYGFISAGQGPRFVRMMKRLEVGDTVYAYVTGAGYVGFGKVIEKAVPIKEFIVQPDNVPLLEMNLTAKGLDRNKDDDEYCEWAAQIDWRKTFSKDEAIWFKGAFNHLGTACKFRDKVTLSYLHEAFDVPEST